MELDYAVETGGLCMQDVQVPVYVIHLLHIVHSGRDQHRSPHRRQVSHDPPQRGKEERQSHARRGLDSKCLRRRTTGKLMSKSCSPRLGSQCPTAAS